MRDIIVNDIKNLKPKTYSASEVKSVLDNLIINVKNNIAFQNHEYNTLSIRVISPNRAKEMARDVFTNHQFKNLRKVTREIHKIKNEYEKEAQRILTKRDYAERNGDIDLLNECNKEVKAFVQKHDKILAEEKNIQLKINQLEGLCNSPEGIAKIQSIADGILSKNADIKAKFEIVNNKLSSLKSELKELKSLSFGVDKQVKADKNGNTKYFIREQVSSSSSSSNTSYGGSGNNAISLSHDIKLLAQAFNGIEEVAPLIARIDEDTNEISDYKCLSLADRQAKRTANIFREFS